VSEPLDLGWYQAQHPLARNGLCTFHQGDDGPCEARAILAEVERLRAELARRDQQITAVRALCDEWREGDHTMYMDDAADDIDIALDGRS